MHGRELKMAANRNGQSGFGEGDADDGDEDDYNNEDDDGDAQLPATDLRLKPNNILVDN